MDDAIKIFDDDYARGYKEGNNEGYLSGYTAGKKAGFESARNSVKIGIGTTAAEVLYWFGRPDKKGTYDNNEMVQVREIKGDLGAYIASRFASVPELPTTSMSAQDPFELAYDAWQEEHNKSNGKVK